MYSNEEPRDQVTVRNYASSPLDWLASMPVIPPQWRKWYWGSIWLAVFIFALYWLMPRWGMSPFHTRQDGMDFFPYRTELTELALGIEIPQTAPDSKVALNLVGNWPNWRLAHYPADGRNILAVTDEQGKVIAAGRAENEEWLGVLKLESAHWSWHGGWQVEVSSPHITDGQLYISPSGELRLMRHEPNAAGQSKLARIEAAGVARAKSGKNLGLNPSAGMQ
jgi:hypothetical protein